VRCNRRCRGWRTPGCGCQRRSTCAAVGGELRGYAKREPHRYHGPHGGLADGAALVRQNLGPACVLLGYSVGRRLGRRLVLARPRAGERSDAAVTTGGEDHPLADRKRLGGGTAAAGSGSGSSARMSTATPAATTSGHAPRTSHLPIGFLHPPARPRGEPAAGSAGSISYFRYLKGPSACTIRPSTIVRFERMSLILLSGTLK
jgi:hypothetical protein